MLSLTQVTSWGVLYYAFATLQGPLAADTGWSPVAVSVAFSASQLVAAGTGVWVGRRIDRRGPRLVMTGAALVAVPAVLLVAFAPSYPVFCVGWVLVGLAMAGTLYPPAFAALTHWAGERRVVALTTVTLAGGLASTVFAPLSAALSHLLGWRGAFAVLTGVLAVVVVPLHWWGLRAPWRPSSPTSRSVDPVVVRSVAWTPAFVLLAGGLAMLTLSTYALVVNLVPALTELGLAPSVAATALGLGGVGQVTGRLGYARFAALTSPATRLLVVAVALALTTAGLALAPPVGWLVVALGVLVGLFRGVFTLVQATAVSDRWGTTSFGTLNGLLGAPSLVAAACSPFVGAGLATLLGGWSPTFVVLALLAGAAGVVTRLADRTLARP